MAKLAGWQQFGLKKNKCYKCSIKKGILSPLYNIEGLRLCGSCKKELKKLLSHKGYNGVYYCVEPHTISLGGIDKPQL